MFIKISAFLMSALLVSSSAVAQDYRYDVFLDVDANSVTGCTVTLPSGTIGGVESRIRAEVTGTAVTGSTLSTCSSGSFGTGTPLRAPYAVGLNNGTAGSDVIEMSAPSTLAPAGSSVPVHVAATNGAGTTSDILSTTNGLVGGPPILLGFPVINIPILGTLGLGLTIVLLVFFGLRRVNKSARAGLAAIGLLVVAGAVWAAAFAVDGQVADWGSESELATDPAGDGSAADNGIDLRAFFAAFENGRLFVRVDVADVENQAPVASPVNLTVLEDAAPQNVTLSGTDADGDPMTFTVQTNPTLGTLGAVVPINTTSASVQYMLVPDANGNDSFTYIGNDGFVNSAPAMIAIAITPVNDAPLFTAQDPLAVNEDAGSQTATVATGIAAGPANESAQVLTFSITGNSNPALFSAGPTINGAGQLSYTPAANVSGSATLSLQLQDNGGTANGGIDTAAVQNITVAVNAINDAPSFIVGANQTVLEDAGAQNVLGWATGISPGPADEAGQTLAFNVTGNTNPGLFSAGPAISAAGDLSYTPAANANGTATLTITLGDNGGTANGGIDTSAPATFTINITAVNDAPSFVSGGDVVEIKDTGANVINAWASAINAGPADEAGQTLTFNVTNNTNPGLFSVQPAVSSSGTLSFTTLPNANGTTTVTLALMDNGGTANGGVDASVPQVFDITLSAVNDAPSFTPGANQTVLEDAGPQIAAAWASGISAGPPDESGQVLTFNVTGNSNPGLFSVAPVIDPGTGTLAYTPAANANGSADVTVTLSDNGGTANGGIDTSAPVTFSITVTAVNDRPGFAPGLDSTVNEDAGPQAINPWATAISAGPADEAGQTLTFNIIGNTNPALFSAGPAISPTGVLTFTPAANTAGTSTVTINLQDNGGTADGGIDTSAPPANFTITVNSVNDAPSFSAGPNQTVLEDSGAQTVNGWGTAISPGPFDESGQTVTFIVTGNTNPALFSAGPAVSAAGVLTYMPAANAFGTATISVTLQDNGGVANGGSDTSAAQNFTITITGVNDPPSFVAGPNQAVPQDAGPQTVNPWATAISAGPANEAGQTLSFNITGNTNSALFSAGPAVSAAGVLTYTPAIGAAGTATISLNLMDNGGTANGGVDTTAAQDLTISVDSAPIVSATNPSNGSTVANNIGLSITFSENVNVTVGAVTLSCGGPNLITGGDSGANVGSLTPTYISPLPSGNCTMTILAANITDADAIDPPDSMAANLVVNFTVDTAPSVNTLTPTNGATDVAGNAPITITFSEQVFATGTAFSVECPIGVPAPFTASVSPATVYTLTPNTSWPSGMTCTVTVVAAQITDADGIDPPDTLTANVVSTFTTDAAPTVNGGTPLNGATNVSTTATVTYTFSENVDAGPGAAITLDCGGPITGTVSGTGTSTLTFTPGAALPTGTACTATAVAANIGDSDANDPPNSLAADSVRTFTTDAPPAVVSTAPTNGATGVLSTSTIAINFSESVNFDTTANAANSSFDLECPVATPANFTVSTGSPAAIVVLDPLDVAVAGQTCALTVRALGITDQDVADPPDNMLSDAVATIQFAGVAVDDLVAVTPHLTLSSAAGATELDANDILGSESIASFGFGACTGTTVGNQLDAGAANGRLTINANGSFSYEPPAGAFNTTRTFCYTLTGGDTANVDFNIANAARVWFVAAAAAAGGNGTQARPFNSLTGAGSFNAVAADAIGDTIYLEGNHTCGLTLLNTQRVIGGGSAASLATLSGVTPVAGSAFPAVSGTRPLLTASATCLTLGSGNTIRGFDIGNTGNANSDIAGTGFGTLTIDQIALSGSGRALSLTTGTITGAGFDRVISTGSANQGISLAGIAGTLNLGSTTISGSTSQGILVGTSTGTINFGNTSVTGGTDAISLQNNAGGSRNFGTITTSGNSAVGFLHGAGGGTVSASGLTTISNPVGIGVDIQNNTTAITFSGLTVNKGASAGAGININGSSGVIDTGVLAITTSNGSGLTFDNSAGALTIAASSTIAATNGPAINSSNSPNWAALFATVSSTNSTTQGINLNSVGGTITMNGGAISGSSGVAFLGQGTLGTITYAGTINKASAGKLISVTGAAAGSATFSGNLTCNTACTGIEALNRGAGTFTFSGGSKVFNTGTNTAVNLDNNDAAQFLFSGGGLAITTTAGNGFNAINGATAISVSGTLNTISSTTGTALNVQNSLIGASGLTFQSISANGGTNGIVLENTLSAAVDGGLRVLGTGTAGSGGQILSTSGESVRLRDTANVFLDRLQLTNSGTSAISALGLRDETAGAQASFELRNSVLTSPGDADNESAMFFGNMITPGNNLGLIRIADTIITDFEEHGIELANNSGALTVTVTGTLSGLTSSTMRIEDNDDTHGQQGILVTAFGTASITSNVSGVYFDNIESAALDARSEGPTASLDVNWTGNVSINGGGPDEFPAGGGAQIVQNAGGSATFDINGNTIRDCFCDGIVVIADGPSEGRIQNNVVSKTDDLGGTIGGDGIRIDTDQLPGGGNNFTATIQISGNSLGTDPTFPGIADDGIQVLNRDGTKTLNLTIENNIMSTVTSEGIRFFTDADVSDGANRPDNFVRVTGNSFTNVAVTDVVYFQNQDTARVCTHVSGNTFAGANRNISVNQLGAPLQITQASVAALAAANGTATSSSTGTITFSGGCTSPPLPSNP